MKTEQEYTRAIVERDLAFCMRMVAAKQAKLASLKAANMPTDDTLASLDVYARGVRQAQAWLDARK